MRPLGWLLVISTVTCAAALVAACDDEGLEVVKATPAADSGPDSTVTPGNDSGSDAHVTPDSPAEAATDAGVDAADAAAAIARGQYIVDTLAGCGDCHTPRLQDGTPDITKKLSGVDCLVGVDLNTLPDAGPDAGDAGPMPPGCLSSRNLTNHATGLATRSDQEIKDMFQKGNRPGGGHLFPVMPYWMYANLTNEDADAIVAYLRTVPGVDHTVKPAQPPFDNVQASAPALNLANVPTPADAGTMESAMRGRYLAATVSGCIDCHTPETSPGNGQLDTAKYFAGNREFDAVQMGIPSPPFPAKIYSKNLTPDSTGTQGYAASDFTRALKFGLDRNDGGVCPPMPAGPHGPFGGMTDSDTVDIANFFMNIPPVNNPRTADCVAP